MVRFLIYLIEVSICTTILYGVYWLFFRKETFFRFNRIFLIAIILFSLSVPVIHVSVNSTNITRYEQPVKEIHKLKEYYSRIIALTDPEFYYTYTSSSYQNAFEGFGVNKPLKEPEVKDLINDSNIENEETIASQSFHSPGKYSWIHLILWVYLAGITIFFFRLVSLFFWLWKLTRTNTCKHYQGFVIVQLPGEIPPFSFFRYVFVSSEVFDQAEFDQILAHESTHIRQLHSLDLILAQTVCMLQWFNPMAWQLQKAIKTNHEYLADEQVISQGFELFDYQSLLLTQLISIRSVELVNNFNLLSIQKRIAMMTKVKSGFSAKLKILLSVPFAIALFFFFTDMTLYGSGKSITNFVSGSSVNLISQYSGVWESKGKPEYGELLLFTDHSLHVLSNKTQLQEYQASMTEREIILDFYTESKMGITYQKKGNQLLIWWNEDAPVIYTPSESGTSLHYMTGGKTDDLKLPTMGEYHVIDWPEYFDIIYDGQQLYVGEQMGKLSDINAFLKAEKASMNKLALKRMTAKLYLAKDLDMESVFKITQALRKQDLMKIAYMVDVPGGNALQAHSCGRLLKLPPLNAEIMSNDALNEMGIAHLEMDADKPFSKPDLRKKLRHFITSSDKYVMTITTSNQSKYTNVLELYDAVFEVIATLRNEYAQNVYQKNYDDLSDEDQNEVRNKYPITLSLKGLDDI